MYQYAAVRLVFAVGALIVQMAPSGSSIDARFQDPTDFRCSCVCVVCVCVCVRAHTHTHTHAASTV